MEGPPGGAGDDLFGSYLDSLLEEGPLAPEAVGAAPGGWPPGRLDDLPPLPEPPLSWQSRPDDVPLIDFSQAAAWVPSTAGGGGGGGGLGGGPPAAALRPGGGALAGAAADGPDALLEAALAATAGGARPFFWFDPAAAAAAAGGAAQEDSPRSEATTQRGGSGARAQPPPPPPLGPSRFAAAAGGAFPPAAPFPGAAPGAPGAGTAAAGAGAPPPPARAFRGVSKHRLTGRWEASLWLDGRQLYLGGFEAQLDAARAYDLAALATRGAGATTNFPAPCYAAELAALAGASKEEVVAHVRRRSAGFARGRSRFRGVSGAAGRWEARVGAFRGRRNVSLGCFATEEGAARAYDAALAEEKGRAAKTNFPLAEYRAEVGAHEARRAAAGAERGRPAAPAARPAKRRRRAAASDDEGDGGDAGSSSSTC